MEREDNEILRCKRCHRKLKDENSKHIGFGKVCYEKWKKLEQNYLFDIDNYN